MWILLLILVGAAGCILAGCQATRAGYESAAYTVVRSDGNFEVRDYPALTVVETPMALGSRDGSDGSFMRLFHFISGSNAAQKKIPMTTPVFMAGDQTNATMAFVLPAKIKTGAVPLPTDRLVNVRELPAGRFAVLRYRGGRNPSREAAVLARLQAWMKTQQMAEASAPVYAYFDPPWTPPFLRRNEVMVRTSATP